MMKVLLVRDNYKGFEIAVDGGDGVYCAGPGADQLERGPWEVGGVMVRPRPGR